MRRLLFNPLEQQPYASGEYAANSNGIARFTLDKPIEQGHLYYGRIVSSSAANETLLILDTLDTSVEEYVTTPFIMFASDGIPNHFYGTATKGSKYIDVDRKLKIPTADESYIICIYQLM